MEITLSLLLLLWRIGGIVRKGSPQAELQTRPRHRTAIAATTATLTVMVS
jgi:hypothetical protein